MQYLIVIILSKFFKNPYGNIKGKNELKKEK